MAAEPHLPAAPPTAPSPGSAAEAFDWAATPLGPRDQWPAPLRTAVGIALGSNIAMMVAWGPDLRLIHNDSYGEILGDRRPSLGRPLAEVWTDDWDQVKANVDRVMRGETVYADAVPRVLRRGGGVETAWLTFCACPVRDEADRIAGIFVTITAVGSDARNEQRVRESEARFRLIADSAPALMWVTRLDRRRDFVNRAYVDFLGISYEQAVDFDWREVLHPDDHDRIIAESVAGEASMKPFMLEARYRRHDGAWRWVRSLSQPRWGPGGEHVGFIGVAHDVTDAKNAEAALRDVNDTLERKVAARTADLSLAVDRLQAEVAERERAEEALRQAQKMEAIGRLTGGIAHDFNNLLTPVIGGLEVIASRVEDPRLRSLAEAALESSRRGAKLTTQLLAFSRLQRLHVAPVAVNRLIANLRRMLDHTIGPGIAIRPRLSAEELYASCDENQLENAILNLALNARDAMPEGGTLTISTDSVRESDRPDIGAGDYVRITVADTGSGMTAEVAARATEPFFSTKPVGKGTGLGLAQVYGIARQAGGTVRLESREGEGTTVCILLPRADPQEAEGPEGASDRPAVASAAGARIAVVDDDAHVRAFLADLLGDLGHTVAAFQAPAPALAAIERDPPDLVLVDFAMPLMNGAQLAAAIRRLHPEMPIAFITGFAETRQLEAALGTDVPVLRKPFGADELAELVSRALGRSGAGDR